MKTIENQQFDEERALYGLRDTKVLSCVFDGPADGESAFKECQDITAEACCFNLRYPFWHVRNGKLKNIEMTENCRAALWYCDGITIGDSRLHGIKALRECKNISLSDSDVKSEEFFWRCDGIDVKNSSLTSVYPFFESRNITIDRLKLTGKYSFQYVENMTVENSEFDTKDAFWHSKNVTVRDSVIKGEYLGWYSENLTFIRCKLIGTQPLCYCKGLTLIDCTMEETDLSFERSEVQATVEGRIDSVKNPVSGSISAGEIGELIMESAYIDPEKTEILCDRIGKRTM